ncbi:MAG: modB [Herminiimonas sp.]|nr:modB [Herminiimonas sp.]
MDWTAFSLSVKLAACTAAILLPAGIFIGRLFAWREFVGKSLFEAAFALPLVLPPTVLGYYLLAGMGGASTLGRWAEATFGHSLVFSFSGLLIASIIFNLPFAIQPVQRALESIPVNVRHAAACCGLSWWRTLWRIELPLAWPGILSALVMTFAHTLGEFGVVLMVGGSIPGETKTIAVSIYDRVQAFDTAAAGRMSAVLLLLSLGAISISYYATNRFKRRHA